MANLFIYLGIMLLMLLLISLNPNANSIMAKIAVFLYNVENVVFAKSVVF